MNFRLVEGAYPDLESIHDDFCEDYLWSGELSNVEIRKKYGLTVGEFNEFASIVKREYGFNRRPRQVSGRYYYKRKYGWAIQKVTNGIFKYYGFVPTENVAKEVVRLCILSEWEVNVCLDIVQNWREHIKGEC